MSLRPGYPEMRITGKRPAVHILSYAFPIAITTDDEAVEQPNLTLSFASHP